MSSERAPRYDETTRQLLTRWALAAAFVVLAHGSVAFAIANWPVAEPPTGEPPAAVMIELAPLPVAPETPPQEVAVGVAQEMSEESTPTDAKEEPIREVEPEPEVEPVKAETPEAPPPDPVEREAAEEIEMPSLPKIETASAVLDPPAPPLPQPKPEIEEKKPEEKKKVEKKKQKPRRKSMAQSASAPKPVNAKRARTNAAPTSGIASSNSIATWRGSVMAHLNRHKRYPREGGHGTASIAFRINRSGHVLSSRLIRSSGSTALDREAVALARRASPLPPPPPNIGGGAIVLTVPVRFSR